MEQSTYLSFFLCLIALGCWSGAMTTMHQAKDMLRSADPTSSSKKVIRYVAKVSKHGGYINYAVAVLFAVAAILAYNGTDKNYVWGAVGAATVLFGIMVYIIDTASELHRIQIDD